MQMKTASHIFSRKKSSGKATSAAWNASTCLTHSHYFGVVLQAFANTGLAGDVR
jgi:hypothetical protein